MKKSIFVLVVLVIFSCEDKDVRKRNVLYAEWEWEATLFPNGDVYRSAAELDSTFYLNFKENGILEIKDVNKTIKYYEKFELTESNQNHGIIMYKDINDSELHFYYSIENDELKISNMEGFIVWVNKYKSSG
jgi:hypothetical protein